MKIGELSALTGTPVETIRYYEREGLLPAPARTDANYRVYDDAHLERLQTIRHCRALDMTLEEIRTLLRLSEAPGDDCAEVNALLDAHIGHVATRIRELKSLERQLKTLRSQCRQSRAMRDCGILRGLAASEPPAPPADAGGHRHGRLGATHG